MSKKIPIPRGTADILPGQSGHWNILESRSRDILGRYGYREIRTPAFEETELFARSVGQTSDIVQKQMLNLAAQLSELDVPLMLNGLSLRPEGTASVVRSYIQNDLHKKESLSKLYYLGPMFRGERPQKGRLRQFHQIGVEAIGPGTASPYLDADVIALAVNLLKELGVKDFKLQINTLGTAKDKKQLAIWLRDQLKGDLKSLETRDQERFDRNVFRLLDSKDPKCKKIVAKLDLAKAPLSPESRSYFEDVQSLLTELKVPFTVNPYLVRGLDYYTHTVFELICSSLGSQDAVGAGGRYNNLVQDLGGAEVDAVGFALGIERILLAQGDLPTFVPSLDVFVAALVDETIGDSLLILNKIRQMGFSADMNYRSGSLKSQMRAANKAGACYVVMLGTEERENKSVTVKNMDSGEQQPVAASELVAYFENIKKGK